MNIEEIRKRERRQNTILIEEIKAGKVPLLLQFSFFLFFFTFIILIATVFLRNLTENLWTIVILAVQTIILLIQSWVIRNQTKFNKIPIQPEFIIRTRRYQEGLDTPHLIGIYVKNIGQTAHRVNFGIKATKKGEKLDINKNRLERQLFTFQSEQEKFACELLYQNFKETTIRINLEYSDKIGGYCIASFLKLSNEEEFMPIFTGLE